MAIQRASKTGATPFKFEDKGDTLKGYYLGTTEKTINDAPAKEHTYKTADGVVAVLGQSNILKQYENNGITPGTYVELRFTGDHVKLSGGRKMKVYDVDYDKENTIDPSTVSIEAAAEDESEEDETPAIAPAARPVNLNGKVDPRVAALLASRK